MLGLGTQGMDYQSSSTQTRDKSPWKSRTKVPVASGFGKEIGLVRSSSSNLIERQSPTAVEGFTIGTQDSRPWEYGVRWPANDKTPDAYFISCGGVLIMCPLPEPYSLA